MSLSDGQSLELMNSSLSSVITTEQELSEPNFSPTVTFEEALVIVNNLLFAQKDRYLSEAEITVMRGAWDNRDFVEIAENSPHTLNYLQRRLAPQLWHLLSEVIGDGEQVFKRKLRPILEQVTKKYYAQHTSNAEQTSPIKNFVPIIRGQLPDVSSFYGRIQELSQLKELIIKQRCISLIGAPGIGKSSLAAKLLTELNVEPKPIFDCLIWKSVTHAPRVQDLVTELIELIQPLEPSLDLPEYTQAMVTALIKQLQSRRCLIVLDGFEALFRASNLEQRLEYRIFFRRLLEEQHQSCLVLTCRNLPDEFNLLIRTKSPINCFKIQGLDADAAMQLLAAQGLTDEEKCRDLINTYRGNPLELETIIERIHHFFAGSAEVFFKYKTTFISNEFQAMLDEVFGEVLSLVQRQIMIYIAEEIASDVKSISFTKLLSEINHKQRTSISTSEIVKALEKLETLSLIESVKDPVTKEISFTLQPVIKKYILTDPQGLVCVSHALPNLAVAS
ncbi:NACHT domain-containing protein [Nostoc sp. WHI]|nr:NACHT domain-containing protein [Nostoc sp. WHI]